MPILIVASKDDWHALAVQNAVSQLGDQAVILDNADFPKFCQLATEISDDLECTTFEHSVLGNLRIDDFRAIWWRRPQPYSLNEQIPHPALRKFAQDEFTQA